MRSDWIGVLARARRIDIEDVWPNSAESLRFVLLRKPHTGPVMVRGRAGGTGNVFNLGEMTVTRSAILS